jgi:predicted GNAT family acetyltransferase
VRQHVARRKGQSGRLQVFKGREARLNRAIFHILALKGPLTIYDIYKEIRKQKRLANTKYAVANRRVRKLEEAQYLKKEATKKTKAGFSVALYLLTTRGQLALLLNQIDLDNLVQEADDSTIITALAALTSLLRKTSEHLKVQISYFS